VLPEAFNIRLFQRLLFYVGPFFTGVFSLLSALDILCAVLTVFGVVGCGLERLTADRAPFCGVVAENLRFQRLPFFVFQQYVAEEFAVDGVGYALYTDAFLAVIQQDTVAIVIVTADFANELYRLFFLPWRHTRQGAIWPPFDGW